MAKREFLVQVDDNGYVHAYNKGQAHSVGIQKVKNVTKYDMSKKVQGVAPKSMIIHNHPSGGHFSDADLINTARLKNTKGVVATGSKGATFTLRKGTHFKADAFIKAVSKAKLNGLDYDHAVHNWLTANQKKYGYKYKATGYTVPTKGKKK